MRVVSLEGCGLLLPLQILCNPIDEPLSQSVRDLGEERAVVVEEERIDGDEGEDTFDDSSECCPPRVAGLIGMIRDA
jgi:hypothetical protein